jgi:hypothetical protein
MWAAWFKYEGKNSLSGIGIGREVHKGAEICPPLFVRGSHRYQQKASVRVETNNSNKSPELAMGWIEKRQN